MLEYIQAYLSPFSWAKIAYQNYLNGNSTATVTTNLPSLTSPILPAIPSSSQVQTSAEWNSVTQNQISTVSGLYGAINTANTYYNSMYSLLDSRLKDAETSIQQLTSTLNSIVGNSVLLASTEISVNGGDLTSIDQSPEFYLDVQPMASDNIEGVFRLADTGMYSAIQGLGGFPGSVFIENSLGFIYEQGDLESITSPSRNSFWAASFLSQGLLSSNYNSNNWLPTNYTDGFALQITYYLDSPILVTEAFFDPVTTSPMNLVSISWSPSLNTSISSLNTATSGNWTFLNTELLGSSVQCQSPSGTVSTTFLINGTGNRAEIQYTIQGVGACNAGARISWLNSSGTVLSHKLQTNLVPNFLNSYRLVDYFPTNAASGIIEFGIFPGTESITSSCTAIISNPIVYIGEQVYQVGANIDSPITIPLPQPVRSSRFSFVLSQPNPTVELINTVAAGIVTPISGNSDLDVTLQQQTQSLSNQLSSTGPNISSYVYRLGLQSLDLRFREHVSQGKLVTLPINTNQEIRWLWATLQTGLFSDGITYQIYPFNSDPTTSITINPFIVNELDSTYSVPGDILRIYTQEEIDAGYYNPADTQFVTNAFSVTETFNGTDLGGLITLQHPAHLRIPLILSIQSWLISNSIWPSNFDPNLDQLVGIPNTTIGSYLKTQIINDAVTGEISGDSFVFENGYVPLNVTVVTDSWTGYQDVYGRPTTSGVKSVVGEVLQPIPSTLSQVQSRIGYMPYAQWINYVTGQDLLNNIGLIKGSFNSHLKNKTGTDTNSTPYFSSSWYNTITNNTNLIGLPISQSLQNIGVTYFNMISVYNVMIANGLVPVDNNLTTQLQTEVTNNSYYATQFHPIVGGGSGQFLRLYWSNAVSGLITPMNPNAFTVDPNTGIIRIIALPPELFGHVVIEGGRPVTYSTPYTEILADYDYISNTSTEDFNSAVVGLINTYSPTASGITDLLTSFTKPYPLCRNMTDYINGTVPTLTAPNYDKLDPNYYPIIEYYLTGNNQIQFSTPDFFQYGKTPATVYVTFDTLNISPRLGVSSIRPGSYATTPSIYGMNLFVKENSSSLLVSV